MFGRYSIVIITFAASLLLFSSCGGGSSKTPTSATPTVSVSPPSPVPVAPIPPSVCFTFPVPRAEASAEGRFMDLLLNAPASCSWTATTAESWIRIERSGSLYQTGDGHLRFAIDRNMDDRFGGCRTASRTGTITVSEQTTNRQARLTVVQGGATGPYRVPTGCNVSPLPYGTTVSTNMGASECSIQGARTRYYTFEGLDRQSIDIRLNGGRFVSGGLRVPTVRLYGPGGGFVVGSGGNVVVDNPGFNRNLSCTGTFTVEVTSLIDPLFNPNGLGNYTLRLTSQN